jgi:UDP-N-acetylglucosamine--N-acetylmuramyl-(pentapeptide) pyrophosphoryl-undecaprenol N-acetylglucosamine transferase
VEGQVDISILRLLQNELKLRFLMPNFVGAKDKMEMQKVPQAGFQIKGCGFGLQRKITLQNMMFPLKLADSLWKANKS